MMGSFDEYFLHNLQRRHASLFLTLSSIWMMSTLQKRKVTLEDIAREAGVSVSTASRALNGHPAISAETRERVLAVAQQLNYLPTMARAAEVAARPKTIAMLVTDIHNPYHNSILQGMEDAAGYDNTNLVLMTTRNDPAREEQVVRRVTHGQFDGVVMLNSCLSEETILAIQGQKPIPMVIFNYTIPHSHIGCVVPDTRAAAYRAANYLISLGHRRIAYIGAANRASKMRMKGVQQALADAGMPMHPELFIERRIGDEERGRLAMQELLEQDHAPSAIIALNDLMAIGAMSVIQHHGLRIPQDISIIGFDDIPISAYLFPALTTVAIPTYRMGQLAIQLIRRIQAGENMLHAEPVTLECPLVVRESTGPAPAALEMAPRHAWRKSHE